MNPTRTSLNPAVGASSEAPAARGLNFQALKCDHAAKHNAGMSMNMKVLMRPPNRFVRGLISPGGKSPKDYVIGTYLQAALIFGINFAALAVLGLAFALVVAQAVVAAPITWTKADISGYTDVSTDGELVYAVTGHNDLGDLTIHGVTFTQGTMPGIANGSEMPAARGPDGVLDDPDGSYRTFLLRSSFQHSGGAIQMTLTDLTPGEPYLVQIWYVDTNGTPETNDRFMRINDGSGNIVELDDFGGTNNGQFATGTFTADATTQSLSVVFVRESTGATGGWVQLNGLQVRHLRPAVQPRITAFSYDPADGSAEVTIEGAPNARFKLVETADLDFSTPDRDPVLLLGATVGTLLAEGVITDENGQATVQFNLGTGPATFIRAEEFGEIILASFDFEADGQGFTPTGDWAWGTPASDNGVPGGQVAGGSGGSTGAWATVLGDGGAPVNGGITPSADSILRSPDIDLTGITGARLAFAAAVDAVSGDTLEVIVYDAADDSLLGTPIIPFPTTFPATAAWQDLGPFDLPEDAANKTIYLQFRYSGGSDQYLGFYLDDVKITF